jgi:hypothetical protein
MVILLVTVPLFLCLLVAEFVVDWVVVGPGHAIAHKHWVEYDNRSRLPFCL